MNRIRRSLSPELLSHCLLSILTVAVATALLLIARDALPEAVIVLLYLVPVGWSAARWGVVPGLCATVVAILALDFFFIPPFYTFTVGRLEGWLVLAALAVVAAALVASIQSGLSRARASEREGFYMVELSAALAGLRTQDAVVQALACHLQRIYQAPLVEAFIQSRFSSPMSVRVPPEGQAKGKPDRVLPILAAPDWVGEIRLWGSSIWLPPEDSYLFRNFATLAVLALERARLAEAEDQPTALTPAVSQTQTGA